MYGYTPYRFVTHPTFEKATHLAQSSLCWPPSPHCDNREAESTCHQSHPTHNSLSHESQLHKRLRLHALPNKCAPIPYPNKLAAKCIHVCRLTANQSALASPCPPHKSAAGQRETEVWPAVILAARPVERYVLWCTEMASYLTAVRAFSCIHV